MKESGDNFDKDEYDFSDLSEYLKKFYTPEESMMPEKPKDFEDFWQSLNEKIEETEPINKISSKHKELEDKFQKRELTLKRMLEEAQSETDTFQKASKDHKEADVDLPLNKSWKQEQRKVVRKKTAAIIAFVLIIGLTAFASFKYVSNYNYIPIEEQELDWKVLKLRKDQVKRLREIDEKWLDFSKELEKELDETKRLLDKELVQANPNLSLIDKYHREILDKEIMLKREKANIFLEKRFVLDEEQTLKLLRLLKK